MAAPDLDGRVRAICLALPEATEKLSHSAPTYFVQRGKSFAMLWVDGHHATRFPQLWCAAPPGEAAEAIVTEPDRFFRPPYVGPRGWLGLRLDIDPDWEEIAAICADAYRAVAPPRLVALLDGEGR